MLVFRALPQRINFSSLNHGWYKDVDPAMTIDDLAVMLHEEEGIPVACEFVYRGDPLERGHTIAEYGIGTIPVFCFTDQVRPRPPPRLCPCCCMNRSLTCTRWTVQGREPVQPLTRLGAVAQFFHAFANRSMAYRYPHVIGLTLFGDSAVRSCELTELFVNFQAHIDRAVANGTTALFDALHMAAEELNSLSTR